MAFADKIKDKMGSAVPKWIPRGIYYKNKKVYDHIFLNFNDNFIEGKYPESFNIKGNLMKDAEIKYHLGARHMNSSQVMCINFFNKFFERPEYEQILLNILRDSEIKIAPEDKIIAAAFEYEPCKKERTNFDFYMVLSGGIKISFEIKYTEKDFGSTSPDENDPDKYNKKWNNIYKYMVEKNHFFDKDKTDSDEFYKNYQINRNIAYATENDYVLFLTPEANKDKGISEGRKYIDDLNNPQIKNLYWEKIMDKTMSAVSDYPELSEYYAKFYDKYIKILVLI